MSWSGYAPARGCRAVANHQWDAGRSPAFRRPAGATRGWVRRLLYRLGSPTWSGFPLRFAGGILSDDTHYLHVERLGPTSSGCVTCKFGALFGGQALGPGLAAGLAAVSLLGWQMFSDFSSSELGNSHGALCGIGWPPLSFGSAWHDFLLVLGRGRAPPVYPTPGGMDKSRDFKLTHYPPVTP